MNTLLIVVLVLIPGALFADCVKVGSCMKTGEIGITCTCNDPVTVVIDVNELMSRLKEAQSGIEQSNTNIANLNEIIIDLENQIEVARQLGAGI